MKVLLKCLMAGAILLLTQSILAAPSKVQICHLPPGNPGNFHTITVSEKALGAHLAHGDFSGPCSAYSEILCDDGNICTIDALDPETETCLNEHPPVNCDDDLLCTADSCDPAIGCQYAPIECDDGDLCTVDACSEFNGECTSTPIDCGPLGVCLEDGMCDFPCEGIICEPIDQCHEAGQCMLPGECAEGIPLPYGTPCDDGNPATYNEICHLGACSCEMADILAVDTFNSTATSTTVGWVTDQAATTRVEYGVTASFGLSTPTDMTLVTSHTVNLSGLTPFTIYYFRVVSASDGCSPTYSPAYIFRTPR